MLNKIRISNFRGFNNFELEFGKKITAICGRNGTSKTTLLGMIAQVFDFNKTYKTLFKQNFYSEFSDNFKFSKEYEKFEKPGSHLYEVFFDEIVAKTTSKKRIDRSPKQKLLKKLEDKLTLLEEILIEAKGTKIDFSEIRESFKEYNDLVEKEAKKEEKNKVSTDFIQKKFENLFKKHTEITTIMNLNKEIVDILSEIKEIEKEQWNLRLVTTIEKKTKKIIHPVVYLGLDRVFPLGAISDENININSDKLNEYLENYNKIMEEIFTTLDPFVKINSINSNIKINYIGETNYYDSCAVSVGQDNLSKIIWMILSFQHLKEVNPDYQGGILLIDEIEASLHPAAQKKLIKYLYKVSKELELQIILTTHSITVIEEIIERINESKIIGLKNVSGKIEKIHEENPKLIVNDLKLEAYVAKKGKDIKINVYTEDEEARIIFKLLLEKQEEVLKGKLNIIKRDFSKNDLKKIVKYQLKEFEDTFFIFDGDVKSEKFSPETLKQVAFLPGEFSIEKELYNFLSDLSPDDIFWHESNERYYTKEIFLSARTELIKEDNTDNYKKWYNDQKKYFGKNDLIFRRWLEINEKNFKEDISNIFNKLNIKLQEVLAKQKNI